MHAGAASGAAVRSDRHCGGKRSQRPGARPFGQPAAAGRQRTRFGKGRTVSDLGWKDTVPVWPGEAVRIAIDFAHDSPGGQTCVFDGHKLEHEDAGMMINVRVQR